MIIFDSLGAMATEANEDEIPYVTVFGSRMIDSVLYHSRVIIKDQFCYIQLCRTNIGIFLTRISLINPFIHSGNVSYYCLWKLHTLEHVNKEEAHNIILVALLEGKEFVQSLYKEVDTYVGRNVY